MSKDLEANKKEMTSLKIIHWSLMLQLEPIIARKDISMKRILPR
ncbi:hypothetical protein [Scopulibacillus darangshiensis]|nr:hypothetical protein [Scopulibacillus darangshiensis]